MVFLFVLSNLSAPLHYVPCHKTDKRQIKTKTLSFCQKSKTTVLADTGQTATLVGVQGKLTQDTVGPTFQVSQITETWGQFWGTCLSLT